MLKSRSLFQLKMPRFITFNLNINLNSHTTGNCRHKYWPCSASVSMTLTCDKLLRLMNGAWCFFRKLFLFKLVDFSHFKEDVRRNVRFAR